MANPFDFTQHMNQGPAQTTSGGGGGGKQKRKKPNRHNHNGGGGGGGAGGGETPFNDEGYVKDFWLENPQEAWTQFSTDRGFDMAGTDAFGNWMRSQYEPLYTEWKGATLDPAKRDTTFQDFLSGLGGGAPLLGPGMGSGYRDEMLRRYNMAGTEAKGLQYSPYEGFSRWLAF